MSLISSPVNLGDISLQQARQDKALSSSNAVSAPKGSKEAERLALGKSTQEFEAMFLELVLKSMRDSIQKSGLVDGGNAEDIYKSMLDSEYAKTLAGQGSTGLAQAMERQLLERFGKEPASANEPKIAVAETTTKAGLKTYADAAEKAKVVEASAVSPLQSGAKQAKINLLMP